MVLKLDKETLKQLQVLIDERVDQRLEEILGDPDEGLEVREEVIAELKAQRKHRKKLIPGEEIMKQYGLGSK
ncbi:MAG: hypothetical protein HYX80_06950 [Chloroflexi bacterium]|nr:hypothetical protein [Chloroflexota bacterium]